MLFTVHLECVVPAISSVEVEADSEEEAIQKVEDDIEANGWDSQTWHDSAPWEVDWSSAEGLVVGNADEV